jgi:hypothetical protein
MGYYTYKITFKDLPGYFYYGSHKDSGKPYLGSPKTWKHLWKFFDPEIQILQWYATGEEALVSEESIIRATWKDRYSLNENVGGRMSEDVCRKNGYANIELMNTHPHTRESQKCEALNAHPNTIAARSDNARAMNDHPNTAANRIANNEKASKRVLLVEIATGEATEFSSASEAARVLGLNLGNLFKVVGGERNKHKGYTAIYL